MLFKIQKFLFVIRINYIRSTESSQEGPSVSKRRAMDEFSEVGDLDEYLHQPLAKESDYDDSGINR